MNKEKYEFAPETPFLLQRLEISRKSLSKTEAFFGRSGQTFLPKSCEYLRIDANNFSRLFIDEFRKFCQKCSILYALRSAMEIFSVSRYTRKLGSDTLKPSFCQQIYKKFENCQQMYKKGYSAIRIPLFL